MRSVIFCLFVGLLLSGVFASCAASQQAVEGTGVDPDVEVVDTVMTEAPRDGTSADSFVQEIEGYLATFEMVAVPGGEVSFNGPDGDETVTVEPFYIGKTEVPWEVFDIFAFQLDVPSGQQARMIDGKLRPTKPYGAPDRGFGHEGYAALSMTFNSAEKFVAWLAEKTERPYRLVTEAEWVHACRAGDASPPSNLDEVAWHAGTAQEKTQPISQLKPNAFGLHDMLGNAGEWTRGKDDKPSLRGGSYLETAEDISCDFRQTKKRKWQERDPQIPKSQWWLSDGPFVGFRIALTE